MTTSINRKIRRNIRKINTQSASTNSNTYANNEPIMLQSDGLGKYTFPVEEDVPTGYYISKIVSAESCLTRSGDQAIEVFYEIEPFRQYINRVKGLAEENFCDIHHYIKQKYPLNREHFKRFVDAMARALDKDIGVGFLAEKVVGVEEYIHIEYPDGQHFGCITDRAPLSCLLEYLIPTSNNDNDSESNDNGDIVDD